MTNVQDMRWRPSAGIIASVGGKVMAIPKSVGSYSECTEDRSNEDGPKKDNAKMHHHHLDISDS